jgi:N-methylhydantoinase A
MGFRISVDTGGTFTDVVIADAHGIRAIGKALTTPERIFAGMRTAIEVAAQELGLSGKALLSKTDMLIYGTTRATNAVVTKSTAKTAFLTTLGFFDILVLKEGGKYDPHDYSYDYPPPYIPRRYTFEIDERVDAQGNVVRPLDQNQAREVVRILAQRHFEAVAVCLLWSQSSSNRSCRAFPTRSPMNSFPSCANTAAPRRRRSMRRSSR